MLVLKLNRLIERNKALWTNEQGEDEWALINHSWIRQMWNWAPAWAWDVSIKQDYRQGWRYQVIMVLGKRDELLPQTQTDSYLWIFPNGVTPALGNYFLFGQYSATHQLNLENILCWVMCILPVVNNTIASSTTKTLQMSVATNIGGPTIGRSLF